MDELLEILRDIQPDVDYEHCVTLIDDGHIDSFALISLITSINRVFDAEITAEDIVPENFNSARAIMDLIQRLSAE
ncbi:MAG: acyl carrier protein [Gracilibacteraceae bacterium]|jgi:acyl carrier protein|nr:acyl carrier protein [Gracilibacteraceae bacterium]